MGNDLLKSAQQYESESKWIEAANQYTILLADSPTVDFYERAAWCFSRASEYKKAIPLFLILNELEPLSAKWPYMTGYQYYCQKDWVNAIAWFEKALERFPDYFVVKYRLAYAYIQASGTYKKLTKAEYWKAIGHLKDCHKLWSAFDEHKKKKEQSTYFDVNFLHGKVLMDLPNHYLEAIELFQVALSIKPTDEFAKYNLAKTFYLNGEYQKAKLNVPSGNQYYIVELTAYIEAKLGNYSLAVSVIEKLLLRRKKDYLYAFLAEVYLLDGSLEKAYAASQQALTNGSNNHKNYYIAAKVFYRFGLLDKTIENLDRAIKMKHEKYEISYLECEELRNKVLQDRAPDYADDHALIERLQGFASPVYSQGVVCKYNGERGFGFVRSESKDVFFHISNCRYDHVAIGDKVQFMTATTDKGVAATNVRKI